MLVFGGFKEPDVVAYGTTISACERCGEWLHAIGTLVFWSCWECDRAITPWLSVAGHGHPSPLVRYLGSAPDRQAEGWWDVSQRCALAHEVISGQRLKDAERHFRVWLGPTWSRWCAGAWSMCEEQGMEDGFAFLCSVSCLKSQKSQHTICSTHGREMALGDFTSKWTSCHQLSPVVTSCHQLSPSYWLPHMEPLQWLGCAASVNWTFASQHSTDLKWWNVQFQHHTIRDILYNMI